jgi:hypothetical protein
MRSSFYNLGAAPTENTASCIVACLFTAAEMCLPLIMGEISRNSISTLNLGLLNNTASDIEFYVSSNCDVQMISIL